MAPVLDHTWSYLTMKESNDYSNYIEKQCLINFALIENVLYLFCDAFFQSTFVIQFNESSPKFNFTSVRSKNTSNTNNFTYIHVHLELNILHKISELSVLIPWIIFIALSIFVVIWYCQLLLYHKFNVVTDRQWAIIHAVSSANSIYWYCNATKNSEGGWKQTTFGFIKDKMPNLEIRPTVPDETQAHVTGLSVTTAAIFLAGEMAGSGVLALSSSVVQTGERLNSYG